MSQNALKHSQLLMKYPIASFRSLLALSIPTILSLFSASLMGFCDRICLAHYSLEALEGSVSAGYLLLLFQSPIIQITGTAQVFVGLFYGSGKIQQIGQTIWQMIWLAFLSLAITLPASHLISPLFFSGTSIQEQGSIYFRILMLVNFLSPLGAALASYFIGKGEIRTTLFATVISHILNLGLDYFFIFGINGFFPALGIKGAALATAISQGLFCTILFFIFLNKNNQKMCETHRWRFNWKLFSLQAKTGIIRALSRFMRLTGWICIARLMILEGGDYLIILSIGGSIILLTSFINDGLLQVLVTLASNLMGAKEYAKIWQLIRSGALFLLFTGTILALPYLVFPTFTLSFFFPDSINPNILKMLKTSCIWLWLFFLSCGFSMLGLSLLIAARDSIFHMCTTSLVWITSYLPVYLSIRFFRWPADRIWLIMACESVIVGFLLLWRSSKEKWRKKEGDLQLDIPLN